MVSRVTMICAVSQDLHVEVRAGKVFATLLRLIGISVLKYKEHVSFDLVQSYSALLINDLSHGLCTPVKDRPTLEVELIASGTPVPHLGQEWHGQQWFIDKIYVAVLVGRYT